MGNLIPQEQLFNGFIGQQSIKNMLYDMYVCSVSNPHMRLPHTLLIASPGQGKTKLSRMFASGVNSGFLELYAPSIRHWEEISSLLGKLDNEHNVLFIDEVHALPTSIQELLYPIMTDGKYYDPQSGDYKTIAPFTLLAATTDPQYMLRPFRERFVNTMVFQKYTSDDLRDMLENRCNKEIFEDCVIERMIKLSNRVPRRLNSFIDKLNYYYTAHPEVRKITTDVFADFMKRIGLDDMGMNPLQQQYLNILKAANSPVSLATLANLMELKTDVITDIVEPDVIAAGLVSVTSSGRKYLAAV